MKIIRYATPELFSQGCVMSIGNFDGIHLGHQAIVGRVVEKSLSRKIPSVITTFEPHPHEYFKAESCDRIMGLREKFSALSQLSADYLLLLRFNDALANTSATEFIESFLIKGLNVKSLIVGDDFRFGKMRQGDYELLKVYADRDYFELENTNTLEIGDKRVSSSRVRELLRKCKFEQAQQLLGRPYFISGRVAHGEKRGRELGYPTINIRLTKNRTLVSGVFAVEIVINGEYFKGVANMGYRPTVYGQRPQLEVHIFDFDQQCYGQQVKVIFKEKLRDELRFESIDLLQQQIKRDASNAREILNV